MNEFFFVFLKKINLHHFFAHRIKPDYENVYNVVEKYAQPKECDIYTLHTDISNLVKLYKQENSKDRFLAFIISEQGEVLNMNVYENFAGAISISTQQSGNNQVITEKIKPIFPSKWMPAIHLNNKVKQRFVLPLT